MRLYSCLCVFACTLAALSAQPYKQGLKKHSKAINPEHWDDFLDEKIPAILEKRAVPGLQLTFFGPGFWRERSYGYASQNKKEKVGPQSLFQAGNLVWPLTAYVSLLSLWEKRQGSESLERFLASPVPVLDPAQTHKGAAAVLSYVQNKAVKKGEGLALGHLLNMTSGWPPAPPYIRSADTASPSIRQALYAQSKPGSEIGISSYNYAYLAQISEALRGEAFPVLFQRRLQKIGLMRSCLLLKYCTKPYRLAEPLTGLQMKQSRKAKTKAKSRYFPMPQLHFPFPAASSLYSQSREYARFLLRLWKKAKSDTASVEALFLQKHFQYDKDLGGTSYGLFFHKPVLYSVDGGAAHLRTSDVFYIENSMPGYAGLAFISKGGQGAVLLSNKNDLFALYEIRSHLYALYGIANSENELREIAPKAEAAQELQGYYRPVNVMPKLYESFDFLNELQIRPVGNVIELSSLLEKENFVRLYPVRRDLYIARGAVKMDHWRLLIRRDEEGEIIGFDTDLARYERKALLFSAWSIVITLGLLAALPMLIALLCHVLPKKKTLAIPSTSEKI